MPETNPERINPFLIHDFGRVDLPSTFYARIDQVEPGEPEGNEPLTILFDCVGADWVDEVINSDDIWPLLPQAPLAVIQVEVSPPATRGERGAPGSSWARLSFDQEGGIPALRYDNLFGEAEAGFLHPPEPVDFQTAARLDLHFSLDRIPDIDEEQLSALLTPALEADFINVLDVGQGNCNALWKTAGNALLYFDAGGGVLQHAGTFPAGRGFCGANEAPVILSHWDWDHWSSAQRPGFHEGSWLAPRQQLGAIHTAFAASLHAGDRLRLWPDNWSRKANQRLLLEKGNGVNPNDRNGTGLVMTVDSPSGNDGPVLLPGDAGYKLIDSVANPLPDKGPHDYQGIVVPHHGGKTPGATLTPAPTGSSANRLVYSLGAPNHYLQPSPECESSHQGKGWTEGMTRRTDAVGVPRPADVAIAWPGSTTITRGGDFDPAQ